MMQPSMRASLSSEEGRNGKYVYSIFLKEVSPTSSSWELGWRCNNQAPKSRIYTDYNKARRVFVQRLNRELDRNYEVQTASDSVWAVINARVIRKLALRERVVVSRQDPRLRPRDMAQRTERVLQAVPDGERVLIVCSGTESEPYAVDAAGHKIELPEPVSERLQRLLQGHDALSLPKHLDVFEGILLGGTLVLVDVRVVLRRSYDRMNADGRATYLRELIKDIGSDAVMLAPMARGREITLPVLQYLDNPDWHIAASEPVESLWGATDQWLEFGTHYAVEARVATFANHGGRAPIELRTTLGGWRFAGWAVHNSSTPSPGDMVRVRYSRTSAMTGELLDARIE